MSRREAGARTRLPSPGGERILCGIMKPTSKAARNGQYRSFLVLRFVARQVA